jgi:DNA polymerase-3 subunit beta
MNHVKGRYSAGELRKAVTLVRPVINTRNTIPILGCVLVDCGAGEVRATNLDVDMAARCPAIDGVGAMVIPASVLPRCLNGVPEDAIVDIEGARGFVRITCDGMVTTVGTYDVEEFPARPREPDAVQVPASFDAGLRFVAPAISTEETRYYLNGVYFHTRDGAPAMCATDGHRLCIDTEGAPVAPGSIVPRGAIAHLLRLKSTTHAGFSQTRAAFAGPGWRLITKVIDGAYPNIYKVIPTDTPRRVSFDRAAVLRALRRIDATIVTLAWRDGELALIGRGALSLADEKGTATWRGRATDAFAEGASFVGLNAKYLETVLLSFGEEDIAFEAAAFGDAPLVARERGRTLVVMPARVSRDAAMDAVFPDHRRAA